MLKLPTTALSRLRLIGLLEGASFLILLFIAMPLKYLAHMPLAVRWVGMAHGVLFVLYITSVGLIRHELKWTLKQTFIALITSIIPFGIFYADAKLFRRSK
jgi:integral membrane protein